MSFVLKQASDWLGCDMCIQNWGAVSERDTLPSLTGIASSEKKIGLPKPIPFHFLEEVQLCCNLRGPLLYMHSAVDANVITKHMTVLEMNFKILRSKTPLLDVMPKV